MTGIAEENWAEDMATKMLRHLRWTPGNHAFDIAVGHIAGKLKEVAQRERDIGRAIGYQSGRDEASVLFAKLHNAV